MNNPITQTADLIICGGGISGMLLAYFVAQSETLRTKKVLILEKDYPARFARNFSFWYPTKHPFEAVIEKKWSRFGVYFEDFEKEFDLNHYTIQHFRSKDFFEYVDSVVLTNENFTIVRAEILSLEEETGGVTVTTDCGRFRSEYVFDSVTPGRPASPVIMQGYSWRVRPENENFDEGKVTLFDFRGLAKRFVNFYYSLPLSRKESIFYLAGFTAQDFEFDERAVERSFEKYLTETQKFAAFEFQKIDHAKIRFLSLPRPKPGARVIPIGVNAGLIQKATSYGFTRIMENCRLIVQALEQKGSPAMIQKTNLFYGFLDYLTMCLMTRNPNFSIRFYRRLFRNLDDADLLFKFLDRKTTPAENFRMLKILLK